MSSLPVFVLFAYFMVHVGLEAHLLPCFACFESGCILVHTSWAGIIADRFKSLKNIIRHRTVICLASNVWRLRPVRLKEAQWAFQGEVLSHTARGIMTPFAPCLPKGPEGWKAAMQICLEQLLPQNEIMKDDQGVANIRFMIPTKEFYSRYKTKEGKVPFTWLQNVC